MRITGKGRIAIVAVCVAGLCVALAAPAVAADEGEYPSPVAARTFNGGAAGWTSSSSFDGSCIPPVLCPSVTNTYVAARMTPTPTATSPPNTSEWPVSGR